MEGKGYGDGSGDGGQGVVCYNCGKTGHIASECWSAPSNKGKGKEKEKFEVFRKLEKRTGTMKDSNQVRPQRRQNQHLQRKELSK